MMRTLDEIYGAIALRIPDFGEQSQLRDQALRYSRECGCRMSGIFIVVSLVISAVSLVFADPFRWSLAGVDLALSFGAGLVGKALGIGWARGMLLIMRRSLSRRLANEAGGVGCQLVRNG
jgi:hypothetical protein